MAEEGIKVSALESAGTLDGTETLYVVKGGLSKKTTVGEVLINEANARLSEDELLAQNIVNEESSRTQADASLTAQIAGKVDRIPLISITGIITATAGGQYAYDPDTKKIYTSTANLTWGIGDSPSSIIFYTFGDKSYSWDGLNLVDPLEKQKTIIIDDEIFAVIDNTNNYSFLIDESGNSIFKELFSQFLSKLSSAGIPISNNLFNVLSFISSVTGNSNSVAISQSTFTQLSNLLTDFLTRFESYDNYFAVLDSNKNAAMYADNDGVHVGNMVFHSVNGELAITDENKNICAFCDSLGKWSFLEDLTFFKSKLLSVQSYIQQLAGGITTLDYVIHYPTVIFAIDNNSVSTFNGRREYIQRLYRESLLYNKIPVNLNTKDSITLQSLAVNVNTVENNSKPIELTGNGYLTKSISLNLRKTKASIGRGKVINLLGLGDSITDNVFQDIDGTGIYSYLALLKKLAIMDNADFADSNNLVVNTIGTKTGQNVNFTYKGTAYNSNEFDEGRGAWTLANYLRHCAHTVISASDVWLNPTFRNENAWDSLGLGTHDNLGTTRTYVAYSGSTVDQNRIRNTPHGLYAPDCTQNLWTVLKRLFPSGFTYNSTLYTFATTYLSSTEDAKSLAGMNYLFSNPQNPFFDQATAISTSSYAFSMTKYLARYRTCDNAGNQLIGIAGSSVTGVDGGTYTIGSLATNTSAFKVFPPNFMTLCLGENEKYFYPSDYNATFTDLQLLISAIHIFSSTIKIGVFKTRTMGSFYQYDGFNSIPITGDIGDFNYKYDDLMKLAYEDYKVSNVCYIPVYYIMNGLEPSNQRNDIDLGNIDKTILSSYSDSVHPGIYSYYGISYQILSWLYYSLTL